MKDDCVTFFTAVGYVATVVTIFIFGTFIGCIEGSSPRWHHVYNRDEHGEITCEICKELLEKGKTNEHK